MTSFFAALRDGELERALASRPTAGHELAAACVAGDLAAVRAALERDPKALERPLEPWGATALACAAHSPFLTGPSGRTDPPDDGGKPPAFPERARAVRETVVWLLERGADPNVALRTTETSSGESTPLLGAARALDVELVEALLESGADPNDRSSWWDSTALAFVAGRAGVRALVCLEVILAREPSPALVGFALGRTLEHEHPPATRRLLEASADAAGVGGWGALGTHLHAALARGRSLGVVRLLLEHGADPLARDRDGRSVPTIARRLGRADVLADLRERGVEGAAREPLDEALAAALAGDVEGVRRIAAVHRDLAFRLRWSDHQLLVASAASGRPDAVRALLELGADPSVPSDEGRTALNVAAEAGDAPAVRALLAAGARLERRDFEGRTPLDAALLGVRRALAARDVARIESTRDIARALLERGARVDALRTLAVGDDALEDVLVRRGARCRPPLAARFEVAAEAVVDGDLAALRAHLVDAPELVRERSPRPHRATLLHYVAANGVERERQRTPPNAPAVARALLDAGAEPDALAAFYGGGPAQTTLCLAVSSGHPAEAGIVGELVHALAASGARLDGLADDGAPLATALAFGNRSAFDALVAAGARVDDAVLAAAAGRLDLVQRDVGRDGRLREGATCSRVPWLGVPRDARLAAQSALVRAAQLGRLEVVRWLLERGVDPNGTPAFGRAALHEACFQGHADVVRALLAHGADPSRRDGLHGGSAASWAEHGGHPELLALLRGR